VGGRQGEASGALYFIEAGFCEVYHAPNSQQQADKLAIDIDFADVLDDDDDDDESSSADPGWFNTYRNSLTTPESSCANNLVPGVSVPGGLSSRQAGSTCEYVKCSGRSRCTAAAAAGTSSVHATGPHCRQAALAGSTAKKSICHGARGGAA
jgi:hypothetical protein